MLVEVWSDVVCPWCYLGKRRLEKAIAQFEYGSRVEVLWRSFQLNPDAGRDDGPTVDMLTQHIGMAAEELEQMHSHLTAMAAAEGLEYHLDRTRVTNTLDAHRLLHLARATGDQNALEEALFHAYFAENRLLGDHDVLRDVGRSVGLKDADIDQVLTTDLYAGDVAEEQAEAGRLGAQGVPFFVVDRVYGVAGAQSVNLIVETLRRAWRHTRALPMATAPANPDPSF